MANNRPNIKGFTLLEIIVVLGIFLALSVLAFPTTIAQVQKGKMESATSDMSSLIFVQQQDAFSGLNNKNYGVAFAEDSYTLYIGNSLATAESTEVIDLPNGLTINQITLSNAATEINFTKGSLKPSDFGSITITNGIQTFTWSINREGLISYSI